MKDALKMLNSDGPTMGEKKDKAASTFRMDDPMREMADVIILMRALMFGDRAETYTNLFRNLLKQELRALKSHERFSEIIENIKPKT